MHLMFLNTSPQSLLFNMVEILTRILFRILHRQEIKQLVVFVGSFWLYFIAKKKGVSKAYSISQLTWKKAVPWSFMITNFTSLLLAILLSLSLFLSSSSLSSPQATYRPWMFLNSVVCISNTKLTLGVISPSKDKSIISDCYRMHFSTSNLCDSTSFQRIHTCYKSKYWYH